MRKSSTRLNWRAYLPADEREYELYSIAYRRSYSFLVGVLLSVVLFFDFVTMNDNLPSSLVQVFLCIYVIVGFLLAEFVGGRVFVGKDVSFSKKRALFQFVEGTSSSILLLLGFIFISFLIGVFLANNLG